MICTRVGTSRLLNLPEAGQVGETSLLIEASVAVGGQELRAVLVVHRPFGQQLAVLGKEFVALEVRSRELLLEMSDVLDQVVESLPFVRRTGKDDVVGHALLQQAFPVHDGDVGPGVLVGVPKFLKSVDCHMGAFSEGVVFLLPSR